MPDLQEVIKEKLAELFPGVLIYEEDLPEEYEKPSFHLQTSARQINRSLGGREKHEYSFTISYYSNVIEGMKKDCLRAGTILLKEFYLAGGYHLRNKKAETVENTLRFTFDIRFLLQKQGTAEKMQNQKINTELKED